MKGEDYDENYEDEDGSLGYYSDGNKRTLTDEQIAMFRHSEIYSIIRKRQVRQENEETKDDQLVQMREEDGTASPGTETPAASHVATGDAFDEPKTDRGRTSSSAHKRRKMDRYHYEDQSRRSVRDLDAVVAKPGELDYGEEDQGTSNDSALIPEYNTPTETLHLSSHGRKIWWPVMKE